MFAAALLLATSVAAWLRHSACNVGHGLLPTNAPVRLTAVPVVLLTVLSFGSIESALPYVTAVPVQSRVEVGGTLTVQIAPCSLDCPAIGPLVSDLASFSAFRVETLDRDILWSGQPTSDLVLGPMTIDATQLGRALMLLVTVPVDEYKQFINPGINDFVVFRGYAPVAEFQIDVIARRPGFPWSWAVGISVLLGLGALVFRRRRLSVPPQP